ncbi:GntR family transcriptional regulator [Deinococcus arcticus]|uniref:GntR family transcriptional regulator n=1 Tax=Deinococcus arcticus TaxID=2136176 RepID=A0A2T3W9S6_9DEIO|nr:GntR family transcriptional regulator [Deinococcus arcticus]PTA68661.1 GntR family transcriptional regulator [Deinococcus arcticus]
MTHSPSDLLLMLELTPHSVLPLHVQLAARLRRLIDLGVLAPGEPLPTVRELSAALRVAPATIVRAYAALQDDQMVQARAGAGTVVRGPSPTPEALRPELLSEFQALAARLLRAGIPLPELQRCLDAAHLVATR